MRFGFARIDYLGGIIGVALSACFRGARIRSASFLVALAARVMRGAGDAAFLAVRAVRRVGGGVFFDNFFVVIVGVQVSGVDGVGAVQAGAINLHSVYGQGGRLCRTRCSGASCSGASCSGGGFRCGSFRARGCTREAIPRAIRRAVPCRRIGCCAVLYRVFCLVLFRLIHSVNDTPRRCVCVSISLRCGLCAAAFRLRRSHCTASI